MVIGVVHRLVVDVIIQAILATTLTALLPRLGTYLLISSFELVGFRAHASVPGLRVQSRSVMHERNATMSLVLPLFS